MLFQAGQALLVLGAAWIALRLLKTLFGSSPLDIIPGPPSNSFLRGHFPQLFDQRGWEWHKQLAATFGSVVKLRGPFGSKTLYVYDPKALHNIIVKDQHIFEETPGFIIGSNLIFGEGLLATLGNQHRKQRKMLNPVFSITHMREMVPIFYDVTQKLQRAFLKKVSNGPQEIDVLQWMSRTALELIGQSGLGYSFDPLTDEAPENTYTRQVKRFNDLSNRLTLPRQYILPLVSNIGTPKFRRWVIDILPWKALKDMRDVADIMHATSVDVIESKRKAMKEGDDAVLRQVGGGKDIMSILLRANMTASEEDRMTDDELFGQVTTLIFAAMDTTSGALARTLFLLSQHQEVQAKLRAEIREAHERASGYRLGYDELVALPYLDAVCRETLRMHPPIPTLVREAREDAILPFSKGIRGNDGSELHEILVPKGTKLFVSALASNRNPDIWGPDSQEWKPERWIEGIPDAVADAKIPGVYSHLMTFLGGGRACIGFKFSQLEMKVVLCTLLDKFQFAPAKGKDIDWRMTNIVTPTVVGGEAGRPQLPLLVSLAD